MSPNLLYLIGFIIVCAILTKSFISASVWLAIPSAWYFTNEMEVKHAILILVLAGLYSQLVALWKYDKHSERIPRR